MFLWYRLQKRGKKIHKILPKSMNFTIRSNWNHDWHEIYMLKRSSFLYLYMQFRKLSCFLFTISLWIIVEISFLPTLLSMELRVKLLLFIEIYISDYCWPSYKQILLVSWKIMVKRGDAIYWIKLQNEY